MRAYRARRSKVQRAVAVAVGSRGWPRGARGTVKGEIVFFKGYAGKLSHFHFNHLISNATLYASQDVLLRNADEHFHPKFHFSIDDGPDRALAVDDNNPGLSDPPL
jgi:hypothetical protein